MDEPVLGGAAELLVILIEDDDTDARLYSEAIEKILGIDVSVLRPIPTTVEELSAQLSARGPSAVIFDERLPVTSDAEYTGIDAIDHFRSTNPDVPIVVLTNFPDDERLKERAFLADMIWDKRKFDQDEAVYLKRLQRWIAGLQSADVERDEIVERLQASLSEQMGRSDEMGIAVVRNLAAQHFITEPGTSLIVWIKREDNDEIRLLEVNASAVPTGIVEVFKIRASESIPVQLKVADVTPREWGRIKSGEIALPDGWSLEESVELDRSILNDIA